MSFVETNLDDEATLTPEQRNRLVSRKLKMRRMAEARALWDEADYEAERIRLEIEVAAFPITLCPPPGYRAGPNMRRDSSLI